MHWLDRAFALTLRFPRMFAEGWGDDAVYQRARDGLLDLGVATLDPSIGPAVADRGRIRRELTFPSPVADELPEECRTAHARLWGELSADQPCVVVLAGSGGAGYRRRESWLLPLVERGLTAVLLENPYYGRRTPAGQRGTRLRTFADQLRMNRATVAEALGLLGWLRPRVGRLAVSGFSMGGHMAALTAAHAPFGVGCAALAAGRSPVPIYTTGALSTSMDWSALQRQSPEKDARARVSEVLSAATAVVPQAHPESRLVIVAARRDGFVEPGEARALHRAWPGSELRWLPGGHVTAVLRHTSALRQAVVDVVGQGASEG